MSQISLDSLLFAYEKLFPPLSQLLAYISCRYSKKLFYFLLSVDSSYFRIPQRLI